MPYGAGGCRRQSAAQVFFPPRRPSPVKKCKKKRLQLHLSQVQNCNRADFSSSRARRKILFSRAAFHIKSLGFASPPYDGFADKLLNYRFFKREKRLLFRFLRVILYSFYQNGRVLSNVLREETRRNAKKGKKNFSFSYVFSMLFFISSALHFLYAVILFRHTVIFS